LNETSPARASNGLYRFAQATVFATLCLIFLGGMVTSKGAGLAVPDWPLSYGSLNPPGWLHIENVRLEHGHRLFAGFVGLLITVLAILVWKYETRPRVRWLGVAAFAGVCFQGVLGGLRVTQLSSVLAMAHACMAQLFLCIVLTLAVVLSPNWIHGNWDYFGRKLSAIRAMSWALVFIVYCQLILGAVMRHMNAGLAIPDFPLSFGKLIPPIDSPQIAISFAHRVGALVVTCAVISLFAAILVNARKDRRLLLPAITLAVLLVLQIALGAHVIWLAKAPLPTTLHVLNGALVLCTALFIALRAGRLKPRGFHLNGYTRPELVSEVTA